MNVKIFFMLTTQDNTSIAQKLSNKQSAKVIFVGLINLEQQEQQESKEAYEH